MKYKLVMLTIILFGASGCDGASSIDSSERSVKLLNCVNAPRVETQCDIFFQAGALVKQSDRVRVPGIEPSSLQYYSADKEQMRLTWRAHCSNGCGGFDSFDEWWESF
ncbi:hypothetical protein [Aliidiomarina quisquiliarum]|uniref:hypothetical protein n=1 Tax=Aliidiomarina quisquiliarum TaxID=2938947 RepID=UPI00208E3096|nr:hypothetical protein [Aliidiomarina quisquiliarum]MCO4319999.1 hypothetical protein [Aliidiomarina quisquiliarum]